MNVVMDGIIFTLQKAGGISLYFQNLLDRLKPNQLLMYANNNIFCNAAMNSHWLRKRGLERLRSVNIDYEEPFIFHSSYYRTCSNPNAINITTVHDFIAEYFKSGLAARLHTLQKRNAIIHSDAVICVSESTKRDLVKFFPWAEAKAYVVHNGKSSEYFQLEGAFKEKALLFVGNRAGYKNFDYAVSLAGELDGYSLVLAGGGELTPRESDMINSVLPGRWRHEESLSNDELAILYNKARYLLYTSEYEGFGIPILEAQACGCVPICRKVSSMPEIAGEACIYISGTNTGIDTAEIRKIERDEARYKELLHSGIENAKKYSWDRCAAETREVYLRAYRDKTGRSA